MLVVRLGSGEMNRLGLVKLYDIDERYYPVPSNAVLPEWYKKTHPYLNDKKHPHGMTIKRCIPVFDAITSGYTILLHADIFVSFEYQDNQKTQVTQWSNLINFPFIQSHVFEQFSNYPEAEKGVAAKKFINPFAVFTPAGYSCLFTQPMHQDKSPIKMFEGVVDTDKEHIVNFPFVYVDPNFEGVIPAGTPIAQIIPFKRESWKLEIDNKKDLESYEKHKRKLGANIFAQYRDFFWTRKEYK
jgi:hypothetical protein